MSEDNSKLQEELMKSFHEQFAQNQNHHQRLFIQMMSILLTVIIGYGYVYTAGGNLEIQEGGYSSEFLLTLGFIVSCLMLGLGIGLLNNMAYGFRRDQYVNARIREHAGLINSTGQNIFPENFDPANSFRNKLNDYQKWKKEKNILNKTAGGGIWRWIVYRMSWMPNFHIYFFFILMGMLLFLIMSLLFNPYDRITLFEYENPLYVPYLVAFSVWFILITLIIRSQRVLYNRLKTLYKV